MKTTFEYEVWWTRKLSMAGIFYYSWYLDDTFEHEDLARSYADVRKRQNPDKIYKIKKIVTTEIPL